MFGLHAALASRDLAYQRPLQVAEECVLADRENTCSRASRTSVPQ